MSGLKENKAGPSNTGHGWWEGLMEILGNGIGDLFTDEGGLIVAAVIVVIAILAALLRVAYESWSGPSSNLLG